MDPSVATLVSGIGAAIVAGIVGILSSMVAYRAANKQNENNRRHQVLMSIITRQQQAIEDVWKLLFVFERQGCIDEDELDLYIRSLIWLPEDLREDCLLALKQKKAHKEFDITGLRNQLVRAAYSIEFRDRVSLNLKVKE
ncbi:MAG: hypothetical protein GFH27_549293n317 [Chloroflexi bacterium AL-W]|nr:hypothetical protein [Chloroflexi bacterium AL-N1]NOK67568.1 hypothetical protein [Chloroflexi bacterium AL-N10]NOK75662.1 hypothetical protein [Chloroflexi bacterium AL-N5]NOK82450.1 hypothetical protein [Chloroflexi bacterium AL-W]NOK90295.1 hypothetical protein [Chloroflexi bacterium AL-N15]